MRVIVCSTGLCALLACEAGPDLPLVDRVPIVGTNACASGREIRVGCTIDGDTFDIAQCGGTAERVRLLGLDAPEVAHDGEPADCFGDEAATELQRLIDNRDVALTFDEVCTGVFGRTLAYAWLPADDLDFEAGDLVTEEDGTVLVNEVLLLTGYARLFDEERFNDIAYGDRLAAAEATARSRGVGLWGACDTE